MPPPIAAHAEDGLTRPAPRPLAEPAGLSGFPWLRVCLAGSAALAALAYSAQRALPPAAKTPAAPAELAPASAPPPIWTPIARPLPIYGLDAPQWRALPSAITARRDGDGDREDTLTFGSFERGAEPHLRVILHRAARRDPPEPRFFLELARRASWAGLAVTRSAPPEALATKFGAMEVSEATLSEGSERACLAFRFAHPEVGLRLAGWLCAPPGQAADRQELACTLDRLALVEPGNDEDLKGFFTQADRQRIGGCTPAPAVASVPPKPRLARSTSKARSAPARTAEARRAQKNSAALRRTSSRQAQQVRPTYKGQDT